MRRWRQGQGSLVYKMVSKVERRYLKQIRVWGFKRLSSGLHLCAVGHVCLHPTHAVCVHTHTHIHTYACGHTYTHSQGKISPFPFSAPGCRFKPVHIFCVGSVFWWREGSVALDWEIQNVSCWSLFLFIKTTVPSLLSDGCLFWSNCWHFKHKRKCRMKEQEDHQGVEKGPLPWPV